MSECVGVGVGVPQCGLFLKYKNTLQLGAHKPIKHTNNKNRKLIIIRTFFSNDCDCHRENTRNIHHPYELELCGN